MILVYFPSGGCVDVVVNNQANHQFHSIILDPVGIYLLKVNKRNTRARCEICSKLTIKMPERLQWRRSGIFIVNSEHISHFVVVFLFLALKM